MFSSRDTLRQLIVHRIGKDKFDECLNYIGASENFIKAAKSPRVGFLCSNSIHTCMFIVRIVVC